MKRKRISQVVVFAVTCMGSMCFVGTKDQCEKVAQSKNGEVAPLHVLREGYVKTVNVNSLDRQSNGCKVFIPASGSNTPHPDNHHDGCTTKLRESYKERHRKTVQSIQNEFRLYSNTDKKLVMTEDRYHKRYVGREYDTVNRKGNGKDERMKKLFKKITSQDLQTLENISLITSTPT